MAQRKRPQSRRSPRGMRRVHRNAAGLDVGATFHVVAVPPDHDAEPVRSFPGFTADLHRLADWLQEVGVTTVAMESTGVYWIPVFEILEDRGLEVLLVNARDVKNVPGRKSDVNDAQWIQKLHEHGLLRGSFRPRNEIAALRAYLRQRERLVEYAAAHVQHMQKALMQMNVQLHHAVSDITGSTGLRILRAIISGQRDPKELAKLRDVRCRTSEATLASALTGHYRPEHVFALQQSIELYDFYQAQICTCDLEIERTFATLGSKQDVGQLPPARRRTRQKNEPVFAVRTALHALLGVDLTQIHGLGPYAALKLVAECGDDMSRFPTSGHFASWLSLAPGTKISGGRVLSSKTRRSANRAATLFRLCATSVGKTDTALGAFYRRLAARIGKAKAVTATARKIAVLFYNVLRDRVVYEDPGADAYERQHRERVFRNLRRRARRLGFEVVESPAPAGAS